MENKTQPQPQPQLQFSLAVRLCIALLGLGIGMTMLWSGQIAWLSITLITVSAVAIGFILRTIKRKKQQTKL